MRRLLLLVFCAPLLLGQERATVPPPKCGTARQFHAASMDEARGTAAGVRVKSDRPLKHASRTIPGGHFRVHFDTSGASAPALLAGDGSRIPGTHIAYTDSVLAAMERSWQTIIVQLGFEEPLPDTGGVDALYDVYLEDYSPDLFGETIYEPIVVPGSANTRYASWIQLDNDFQLQRTKGLEGMRVTAAHEYFHAVQLGSYGAWGSQEFYWYELTAVWMEERTFPGVDDYLFDLQTYFTQFRTTSLAARSSLYYGYERSVLAFFFAERFGESFLKSVWEGMRTQRLLTSLGERLNEQGVTVQRAFGEFALWNFFTSDRADTVRSYRLGPKFPRLEPAAPVATLAGSSADLQYSFAPLSTGLFGFRSGSDTVFALLTNADIEGAAVNPGTSVSARLEVRANPSTLPHQTLATGLTIGMGVEDRNLWDVEYLSSATGDVLARTDRHPSPNPWRLSAGDALFVPVDAAIGSTVAVYFLDAAFFSRFAGDFAVEEIKGGNAIRVPASAIDGRIGTGPYVVVLRTPQGEHLTKVAVIE